MLAEDFAAFRQVIRGTDDPEALARLCTQLDREFPYSTEALLLRESSALKRAIRLAVQSLWNGRREWRGDQSACDRLHPRSVSKARPSPARRALPHSPARRACPEIRSTAPAAGNS